MEDPPGERHQALFEMRSLQRIAAVLLPPAAPALVSLTFLNRYDLSSVAVYLGLAYIYSFAWLAIFGLPTVYLLKKKGLANWTSLLLAGAVGGLLFAFIHIARLRGIPTMEAMILYPALGMLCAATYWTFNKRDSVDA